MTKHISGSSVIIDITPQTPIEEIKSKLEAATGMHTFICTLAVLAALCKWVLIALTLDSIVGIPAADQKIMLSGINQLVLGDKRYVRGTLL